MRLFFFAHLSPEERTKAVSQYLLSVHAVQEDLLAAKPEIDGRADAYQLLCYRFGVRFFEDLQRNVSGILKALEEERPEDSGSPREPARRGKRSKGSKK